jgi:lysophospholipase L1-like esterase
MALQVRRGSSSAWDAANPVLALGELAFDTTMKRLKAGDGVNAWSALPWQTTDQETLDQIRAVADVIEGATTPNDASTAVLVSTDGTATKTALDQAIAGSLAGDPEFEGTAREAIEAIIAGSVDDTDIAFRSLRSALDAGRSCAFTRLGDSTGDSDGTNSADLRWTTRFAEKLAAAYPGYRVESRTWDHTLQGFRAPVILQAGPSGPRYVQTTNRSMRYFPEDTAVTAFASGNLDLRIKVAPNAWAPGSGGERVLIARKFPNGASGYSTVNQFRWRLSQSGFLRLAVSKDGTGWNSDWVSSVAVTGFADGAPAWLRVTNEIVPGTSETCKFYTSTDGVTWTQLGTTQSFSGAASAMFATVVPQFEIGAEDWQPSSGAALGKLYEVQIRDGINGPMIAPALPELWERYGDAATSLGGSPTLTLINASRSGSDMSYHTDPVRLKLETPNYGQVLAIFDDSHNEVAKVGGAQWTKPLTDWVAAVQARLPLASAAIVGQNPHTSAWANETLYGPSHQRRIDEARALAGVKRWGFLDFYGGFLRDPRGLTALVQSDGLHPTQDGYELAASIAARLYGLAA